MSMEFPVERLSEAAVRNVKKMDADDMFAMKACLLATGALAGLSARRPLTRRLMGLTCSFLSLGLALPLATRFAEELKSEPLAGPAEEVSTPQEDPGEPAVEPLTGEGEGSPVS